MNHPKEHTRKQSLIIDDFYIRMQNSATNTIANTTKSRLRIACFLLVAIVALLAMCACKPHYRLPQNEQLLFPSVDFLQGSLAKKFSDEDWQDYFTYLAAAGYNAVILQGFLVERQPDTTFTFDNGKLVATKQFYSFENVLDKLLEHAEKHDFDIYIGTYSPCDWWTETNYSDADYIDKLVRNHEQLIRYISYKYGANKRFVGWYITPEMYTNRFGYERYWASLLNGIIAAIEANVDKPLMISSFYSTYATKNIRTDTTFAKLIAAVNFRQCDIFAPQDSFGGNAPEQLFDLSEKYDYLSACAEAAKLKNMQFRINCEFFTSDNDVRTASDERLKQQFALANIFCDKAVSFSFSHYVSPLGTSSDNASGTLYKRYIDLRNQAAD